MNWSASSSEFFQLRIWYFGGRFSGIPKMVHVGKERLGAELYLLGWV